MIYTCIYVIDVIFTSCYRYDVAGTWDGLGAHEVMEITR